MLRSLIPFVVFVLLLGCGRGGDPASAGTSSLPIGTDITPFLSTSQTAAHLREITFHHHLPPLGQERRDRSRPELPLPPPAPPGR